jgi:hypothetical protein
MSADDVSPVEYPSARPRYEKPSEVEAVVRGKAEAAGLRDGAILMPKDQSGVVDWLGIIGSSKGLAFTAAANESHGRLSKARDGKGQWVGPAAFRGLVQPINNDGNLKDPVQIEQVGTVSVCLDSRRLLAIVDPDRSDGTRIWMGMDLSALEVETKGTEGLMKKRPQLVTLSSASMGFTLHMREVSQVFGDRFQTGRSREFVDAVSTRS